MKKTTRLWIILLLAWFTVIFPVLLGLVNLALVIYYELSGYTGLSVLSLVFNVILFGCLYFAIRHALIPARKLYKKARGETP